MPDPSYSLADLRVQRDALLAEIAEPGHVTKSEAREISELRAQTHSCDGAWLPDAPWQTDSAE